VLAAADPAAPLQALGRAVLDTAEAGDSHAAALGRFAAGTDVAALEGMLAHGGRRPSVRGIVLGIGLLLQPFDCGGSTQAERSLALPLPCAAEHRPAVAAFWLALIAPFLRHKAVELGLELALFVATIAQRPMLVVSFAGASPGALRSIIDPQAALAGLIGFDDTGWVDAMIAGDHTVLRLSACLAQGNLSLAATRALFLETFA
jgi:type VI secretion system protein ImpM